jgi:hypothetical protein
MSAPSTDVPSIAAIINRYKAELTIYSRDESPKMITSQDTSQLAAPCAGLSITELPAEQSAVSAMCNQELLY